jgi:hypothetical protein
MRDLTIRSRVRRALILSGPAALATSLLRAQSNAQPKPVGIDPSIIPDPDEKPGNVRLPNGKNQQDEILKADYEKNVKDARDLLSLARSFEVDLEKDEAFVFSLSSLKKLDDMEKLTKRIRGRMTRY